MGPRHPEYDLANSAANPLVERWRGARALSQWILGMPFMNRRIVRNAKTPKHARDMIRIHCQKALQVVRLHVEVTGEPPKIGQGCVVTYNESSFVDVLAYGSVMWDHVDRAAAAELYGKLPFAKEACAKAKIELVPRGDRDGTERLMNRMVGAVQAGERLGWGAEGRLSGKDGIAWFSSVYVPDESDRNNPYASPLYGDFKNFPPMLIQVGTREVLLDDSKKLNEKAKSEGCDVELQIWDDMVHIFQGFAPYLPEANEALESISKFISDK